MVLPRTAWLYRPELQGIPNEGTVSLEPAGGALQFEGANGRPFRLDLHAIRKVRRLRASPVLEVRYRNAEGRPRVAFYYFSSPPEVGSWRGGPISREERRSRRKGFTWLETRSGELKGPLDGWVREIREAVAGRRT